MIEGKPSHTAFRVATRRAAHQILDRPLVFADPIAIPILGERIATALRTNPQAFERSRLSPVLRAFLCVRSRIAEDALGEAVARGVRQYVLLGAGLDTFAYRNPFPDVRVFEVDYPATQVWKRQLLSGAAIPAPPSLMYVSVDFERQNLRDELLRAGLNPEAPTFFAWLGVSMYLERAAIRATLTTIAGFSRDGGGVVFDYAVPPSSLGWMQRLTVALLAARVKRSGEPWRSYFAPADLMKELRSCGFTSVEDLDGPMINARYFAARTDKLRVGDAARIALARA